MLDYAYDCFVSEYEICRNFYTNQFQIYLYKNYTNECMNKYLKKVCTQVLAVYLMAAKLGVPVCPHAGGVGLCNMVPHLQVRQPLHHLHLLHHQAFDFVCLSGSVENRLVEWVDHLHQHFKCPPKVENGR